MSDWDRKVKEARGRFARGVERASNHGLCAGCQLFRLLVLLRRTPYGLLCSECYDGIVQAPPPAAPAD